MAHVSRGGEVTTGKGRTAVRIGWVHRDHRGWQPSTSYGRPEGTPWFRTQADAVRWLYAWHAAADEAARAALLDPPHGTRQP